MDCQLLGFCIHLGPLQNDLSSELAHDLEDI